jgi:hypothetical protein
MPPVVAWSSHCIADIRLVGSVQLKFEQIRDRILSQLYSLTAKPGTMIDWLVFGIKSLELRSLSSDLV